MKYDKFGVRLLERYRTCQERDGSQAFDSLVSIRQYYRLYALLEKYGRNGGEMLDWGCGSGHFSLYLSSNSYVTHSFGFSYPALIDEEIKSGTISFRAGLSTEPVRLPYESGRFDTVTSVGVLEHVREFGGNELSSLLEIERILKPGGCFVCFHFPNRWSWIEKTAQLVGRWNHRYRFDKKDIQALFAQTGFEILECRRYGIFPRNIFGKILPKSTLTSVRVANVFDFFDNFFSGPLRPFCQNWMVVARKNERSKDDVPGERH